MSGVFLFDLDMTLVDSSALSGPRRDGMWSAVRRSMDLIRPFARQGRVAPHELPARLKRDHQTVGIVTSSPDWYAKAILEQFRIPYDVLVCHRDTANHKPDPDPLLEALRRLGVQPSAASFYIGDDVGDVEAAYHTGVTSIGVRWELASMFEFASAAPDIFIAHPATLLDRSRLNGRTYIGEARTSGAAFLPHWGSVLRCDDHPTVYALGRYFTTSDPRHAASALSTAVLSLKSTDDVAQRLGQCVGRAIDLIDWKPDYVVPVPMKPSQQTRNRFEKLLEAAARHSHAEFDVKLDGLQCTREIEEYTRKTALERAEAIRGAFRSQYDWNDNAILLIDDVYTTGETTSECMRILTAAGAGEVRVMTLGKTQRSFARKTCPACGRPMRIRVERATDIRFWGCSGYPDDCRNTERF